jgi:hypothetical protein
MPQTVHCSVVAVPALPPDTVQQLLARQGPSRPFGKELQKLELLGCELHNYPVHPGLPSQHVDLDAPGDENFAALLGPPV